MSAGMPSNVECFAINEEYDNEDENRDDDDIAFAFS
jgi:hypothetical protein